jgi:hypothetical protein
MILSSSMKVQIQVLEAPGANYMATNSMTLVQFNNDPKFEGSNSVTRGIRSKLQKETKCCNSIDSSSSTASITIA